jgi:hypothetical protein
MCNLYSITTMVRNSDRGTELTTVRWSLPPPPRAGGYTVPQHVIAALAGLAAS